MGGAAPRPRRRPFGIKARPLGLRAGLDPARLNSRPDDLEVDAFLERRREAVLHTADTDFFRFPGLRWFNPLVPAGGRRSRRTKAP